MNELDAALARLALSLGPDGADLDGDKVRIEQKPEHGLELRITILDDDGQTRSVASAFAPGDEAPADFPPGVPFVAGAAINVIDDRQRHVLLALWRGADEAVGAPDGAFDRVVDASLADGWTVVERGEGRARLSKGGRQRRIEGGTAPGAAVSMAERPA